jgi:hypothetical protein
VNGRDEYLYQVQTVVLFGSYLHTSGEPFNSAARNRRTTALLWEDLPTVPLP